MKPGKVLLGGLAGLLLFGGQAFAVLIQDWKFNPTGTGVGTALTLDKMTFFAVSNVVSEANPAPGVKFDDLAGLDVTRYINNNASIPPLISGLGITHELTSYFRATGVNGPVIGNERTFTFTTATVDIYVGTPPPSLDSFGAIVSDGNLLGSEDGIHIASFSMLVGDGTLGITAGGDLDGRINIVYQETFLAAGYWFDNLGRDLSDPNLLMKLVTDSNNNVIDPNLVPGTVGEFAEEGAPFGCPPSFTPPLPGSLDFSCIYVDSDGSLGIDVTVIPEPSTMILLGSGLIGIVLAGRRRFAKRPNA